MLLCPKDGSDLLKRVLRSVLDDQPNDIPSLAPRWENQAGWSTAARIRIDEWMKLHTDEDQGNQWGSPKHLRVFAGGDESGVTFSLAMPFDLDPDRRKRTGWAT